MKPISLGPLEQEVMAFVWDNSNATARQVYNHINKKRDIAYNTVQTIMTRLTDKGLLSRKLNGNTHVYTPNYDKHQSIQAAIQNDFSSFISQFGEEALVAFVDGIDDISPETRDKLIDKLLKK